MPTDFKGSGAKPAPVKSDADSGAGTERRKASGASQGRVQGRSDGEAKATPKSEAKSETASSTDAPAAKTGAPPATT